MESDIYLVVLPPKSGNQNVSDIEDIEEEKLLTSEIRDVPGFYQIHRNEHQGTSSKIHEA